MSETHPERPAPGWYADPRGQQRWWDGERWTERTLPPPSGPGLAAAHPGGARPPSPGVATVLVVSALALGVVLLVALTVLNVVLLAR